MVLKILSKNFEKKFSTRQHEFSTGQPVQDTMNIFNGSMILFNNYLTTTVLLLNKY